MSSADPSLRPDRTRQRFLLAGGLVLLAAGLGFAAWHFGLKGAVASCIAALREAGPLVFFVAMAVLPALGFPLTLFTLSAGPVFAPTLGTAWVVVWSLLAVITNLLLTHWLTNRALRPLVTRLLAHFDFHLPEGRAEGAWQTTLIVRLTPGPPFWAQSYLLGMMRVPLLPYLIVSTLVMAGYIVALVCGGAAVMSGNGRLGFLAVVVLVISIATLQLLRQRAARQRTAAALLVSAARSASVN